MLRIIGTERESPAWKAGLRPGAFVKFINGHIIRDALDLKFYSAEENLKVVFVTDSQTRNVTFLRKHGEFLGITPAPIRIRKCRNRCIFCFFDQLPPHLRKSLYIKDEDFRLSFLEGNFVTLSHLTTKDINRIIEQRLSPLYVSVHSSNQQVRNKLLGVHEESPIIKKLEILVKANIQLHTQIVLIPYFNTGKILSQTIRELSALHPGIRSIGIIPVGLTAHRKKNRPLKSFTKKSAMQVIRHVKQLDREQIQRKKAHFIYLSDEWFLLANLKLPLSRYYMDFPQLENGIGMMRLFMDRIYALKPKTSLNGNRRICLVTGMLAKPYIIKAASHLERLSGNIYSVKSIQNDFLGPRITVSGLLSGRDIVSQCLDEKTQELFLPHNCFNSQGLTIDGWDINRISNLLGKSVKVIRNERELL